MKPPRSGQIEWDEFLFLMSKNVETSVESGASMQV